MSVMPERNWVFPAQLIRVIDADTLVLRLDCGFNTYRIDHIRLLGVNAPEVRGVSKVAGDAATEYVRQWMSAAGAMVGWSLIVQTHKSDDFGRYLALVFRLSDSACLNDNLLTSGHAVVYPALPGK
jgi:micrococcal nuclease